MKGVVRRERKRKGGFLLGTAVGIAAGVAGGTALIRRAAAHDHGEIVVVPEPVAGAAEDAVRRVAAAQAEGTARARTGFDALKERWRVAMHEGRAAAKERERELEAQYAFETKRIPPLEVKAIESIEAMIAQRDDDRTPATRAAAPKPDANAPRR